MTALHLIACFFAGALLTNVVPHLVHGISGDPFPTPFANPPGKGLSSPTVNMVWSLVNLVLGFLVFRAAHIRSADNLSLLVMLAGIAAISIPLSYRFRHKHAR